MLLAIKQDVWVGLTDLQEQGVWRFVTDNRTFNPNEGYTLMSWGEGEPNNGGNNQHCVQIWYNHKLDDDMCWKTKRGLCEIQK